MLSVVFAVAGVVLLVLSQSKRIKLDPRINQGLVIATAACFAISAFDRARDATEFIQFTILGISAGCIYAIAATGLVLTYTTTGIFNFAHGALGMVSAFVYWQLKEEVGLPAPIAAIVVLGVLGPLLGLLLELMFRQFRDADVGTSIVLTIAVTVFCIGAAQVAFKASEAHNLPLLFGQRTVTIFDATITWDNVFQIVLAVGIAVGLRALLFGSRTGTAMRAVVDNPALAALNGASPTTVARVSWILGTELAIVAGILFAGGTNLEAITLTFFVLSAYGAAVFGKLSSLPLTFAGAIVLGIIQGWSGFWFPKDPIVLGFGSAFDFFDLDFRRINVALPGIFLFVTLLALPQAKLTVGRVVGRNTPRVPSLHSSLIRAAAFVGAVSVIAQVVPDSRFPDVTRGLIYGVILLSLVLLTGYSGQVSLAQYVFVALGAFGMGSVFGGDSILGMLAAGLIAVPIGALVALPALRLQGLYLALVTFGFASVSRDLLIQDRHLFGDGPVEVGRLDLFGISFAGDKPFLVLCSIVFAGVGVGVLALKRGPFGRRLAAMRDSQAACATLGLDVRRTKLAVFCLSAYIAGLAGSLFGGLQSSVSDIPFEPINNIVLFLFAVVGGITTVTGALLGGALFALLPLVQSEYPDYAGAVFAVVAAVAIFLGRQPNGLAGILTSGVDRWLGRDGSGTTVSTSTSAPAPSSTHITEEVPVAAEVELRHRRRRWVAVATLGVIAAAFGLGGVTSPVAAQDADAFGGFNVTGRANGLQVSYNVENVFPLPPPLFQTSVPEALATSQSGPTATALGSAAYPGNVVGNLPAIIEQSSPGNGQFVPPYPLAARADYPAGPTESSQDIGTAAATVQASADGARAQSTLAASSLPGLLTFGSVTTSASTGFEDGQVVARSRSEVSDISLLFGLIRISGIVTDMVATSNGEIADARGSTTMGSVTVLGLPATFGPDGLVIGETATPPTTAPPGPLPGLTLPPELTGPLQGVVDQLNAVIQQVLGGVGSFQDLLDASGMTIQVMEPIATADGPEASITSNGVVISMNYDGRGDNPLAQLLALIPAEQLPGEGLPGVPLNTSPQALVNLLKETHVTGAALAYGTASVVASPAFTFVATPPVRPSTSSSSGSTGSGGTPAVAGRPGTPSFSTPTPALPTSTGSTPASSTGTGGLAGLPIGVAAVVLALLSSPLWAAGSTKLADNALAPVTSTCPDGLDKPLEPGGT